MRFGRRACKNRKCDKCSCSLAHGVAHGGMMGRMQARRPDLDPNASLPDPRAAGTVIVGMSGGVDSAVAALLLRDSGFAVQGLFMSNWEDDDDAYCTTAADF